MPRTYTQSDLDLLTRRYTEVVSENKVLMERGAESADVEDEMPPGFLYCSQGVRNRIMQQGPPPAVGTSKSVIQAWAHSFDNLYLALRAYENGNRHAVESMAPIGSPPGSPSGSGR